MNCERIASVEDTYQRRSKLSASHATCRAIQLMVIVLSLFPFQATAQLMNLEFESYNTAKGLSQNFVYAIAQDKNGYIWIGTDDGLNRFDGYEFKVFKNIAGDSTTIPANSVRALALAPDSSLWIGTNDGLCRYIPSQETFKQYPIDYTDPTKLSGSSVSDIKIHPDGSVWISYIGDGINVIRPHDAHVMHYTVNGVAPYKFQNDLVSSTILLGNGDVLVATLAGMEVIDRDGKVLTEKVLRDRYPWTESIDPSMRALVLSKDNRTLWIGTELEGLYRVDLVTNEVKNFNKTNSGLGFNTVLSIYEDSRGTVWVGSEAVYLFDKRKQDLVLYNEYGIQGSMVIRNPIYSIFEDRDHNVWMGTFRLGVLKYNPTDTRILHYHTNQGEGSIKNNEILSFNQEDNGNMWIATGGAGLYRLNDDLKSFEVAPRNEDFSSLSIKCVEKDSKGNLWLGTWEGGLMRYNTAKDELEIFNPDKKNLNSWHIWDIKEDSAGNLWLGTLRDGLCYFNTKTKRYTYYTSNAADPTSLVNNDIMALLIDSKKNLWVGTGNGLSVMYAGEKKFKNLTANDAINITSDIILCLYEDTDGNIWIGTNGGGLNIITKDLKLVRSLSQKDGLPSPTVAAIQPDSRNNIWISTYNGLAKIDKKTMAIRQVPQIIGLQGREFLPRSSFRSNDGKLFFGGVNGFNLFHPDSLIFNPIHEKVVLTSLRIRNEEVLPGKRYEGRVLLHKSITETSEITLGYEDYSLTVYFSPLTYNWQNSLHYSYMLENLDNEWQYATANHRFVHYTSLAPGEYTLKIRASFDGKSWPEEARTLHIVVKPAWWKAIWFRVLMFLTMVLCLYILVKIRLRFMRHQQQKLSKLVEIRTNELQTSYTEINTLLKQVAEQRDSIEQKNNELTLINEELQAQRDHLSYKSAELESAQAKLTEVNEDLEKLVQDRTKRLNDTVLELETFLYRASHDIRGPISSMLGLIEVTRIEPDHEKFYRVYNEFLHKTVLQLDRTLQKLLEKHIIEKNEVVIETIDKSTLLKILQDLLRNVPHYRPEYFNVSIPDQTVIKADRMLLSILLGNLLENAFFFSTASENKNVILDIRRSASKTVITVKDHGPGISAAIQEKVLGYISLNARSAKSMDGSIWRRKKGALQRLWLRSPINVNAKSPSHVAIF
jgi:ligand-binding sensor domain-containing protein/signal transduction histidine kinase